MATVFFSVDIETAGPSPARHALLAIGAVRVDAPSPASTSNSSR